MTDKRLVERWYHYAAGADGFIGRALRVQRDKAFLFQQQQRTLLGIQDEKYNDLWLRLQAMPLPRTDQFMADLERIVAKAVSETGHATVNVECLGDLIHAGLE